MRISVQVASHQAASCEAPRGGVELGLLMAEVGIVGQEGKDGWMRTH